MLNQAEFTKLQEKTLSHVARTLYIFYLQPNYRQGKNFIDCHALTCYLQSNSPVFPCQVSFQAVNGVLDELESHGLVTKGYPDKEWNFNIYNLPLFISNTTEYPTKPFKMYPSWQPGPNLKHAALYAGLTDYSYTNKELNEFINYWMVNNTSRNQHSWERAFVQRLIKLHTSAEIKERNPSAGRTAYQSLKSIVTGQKEYKAVATGGYINGQIQHPEVHYAKVANPNASPLKNSNYFTNRHGYINQEQEFACSFSDFDPILPQEKSIAPNCNMAKQSAEMVNDFHNQPYQPQIAHISPKQNAEDATNFSRKKVVMELNIEMKKNRQRQN